MLPARKHGECHKPALAVNVAFDVVVVVVQPLMGTCVAGGDALQRPQGARGGQLRLGGAHGGHRLPGQELQQLRCALGVICWGAGAVCSFGS